MRQGLASLSLAALHFLFAARHPFLCFKVLNDGQLPGNCNDSPGDALTPGFTYDIYTCVCAERWWLWRQQMSDTQVLLHTHWAPFIWHLSTSPSA